MVRDIPSARAHADAAGRTSSDAADPSTHASIRLYDSGARRLGWGVHAVRSAAGPTAISGTDEDCTNDLATDPTMAPPRRPRPRVDRQMTELGSRSACSAI